MRLLLFCLLLKIVTAQAGFGRSYLGKSRLCHEWSCLNTHLNFTDTLPSKEQYGDTIKNLFPEEWQNVLDSALDTCYGSRPKKYTNTCPGQAIMHCVLDHAVLNCPTKSLMKDDACTHLSSLAGYKYMFSQSRYENLEKNLNIDRRPPSFLRNYFHTKCCNVPEIFSEEMLKECGFEKFLFYHDHETQTHRPLSQSELHTMMPLTTSSRISNKPQDVNVNEVSIDKPQDPLECCDIKDFIDPSWVSECGFRLNWDVENRLTILNSDPLTTTAAPLRTKDVKIVPISCPEEECIFNKLNLTFYGQVNTDMFAKLLDNMTDHVPVWSKAKARVLTQCLNKPLIGYDSDCAINKILGCTFDILTEAVFTCNYFGICSTSFEPIWGSYSTARGMADFHINTAGHSTDIKDGVICQISASKYRPKHRRQFCDIPNLVRSDLVAECGVSNIYKLEYVSQQRSHSPEISCKEPTPTNCLLNKMGALNKYGFIDYFIMKDKIKLYSDKLTASLYDLYTSAFLNTPYYDNDCSSSKKLLNVIDAMLLTCPISNRKNTQQCGKIYTEMKNALPNNITREKLDQILKHFKTYYLPTNVSKDKVINTKTNPLYDFGILSSKNIPPVKTVDLKQKTLILLPVYQRMAKNHTLFSFHNDGILRG